MLNSWNWRQLGQPWADYASEILQASARWKVLCLRLITLRLFRLILIQFIQLSLESFWLIYRMIGHCSANRKAIFYLKKIVILWDCPFIWTISSRLYSISYWMRLNTLIRTKKEVKLTVSSAAGPVGFCYLEQWPLHFLRDAAGSRTALLPPMQFANPIMESNLSKQ